MSGILSPGIVTFHKPALTRSLTIAVLSPISREGCFGEGGEARPDLDLHVDGARLHAFESDRRDPREHRENPV